MVGTKESQEQYEKMLFEAIVGMNICVSSEMTQNGERIAIEYIKNKLFVDSQKAIIFDVGANIGNYSKQLIEVFKEQVVIYSFEPSKKTFSSLKNNIPTGALLHNIGFSDKEGEEILYSDRDLSGMASLYKRRLNHFSIEMGQREKIKLDTIDHFCESNGINKISFLKLDIEGNELKVLNGASRMLTTTQFIQFEFGGCNIDSRTYFQDFWYLLSDHYKIYRIVKDGLFEIKKYKEMYELFMTTNFLAEKKL
jgi:FkbM family methyltransferase